MAGLNKVQLIGNLGNNPELKYLPSGQAVCEISVAVNESWTDKSGTKQERTEWCRCTAWAKTAENIAKYLAKGSKVYVEGKLKTDTWEDKETGQKRYATKIQVLSLLFLDGKRDGDGGARGGGPPPARRPSSGGGRRTDGPGTDYPENPGPPDFGPGDDDIPF